MRSNFDRRLTDLEAAAAKVESESRASIGRLIPSSLGKTQRQVQVEFVKNALRHPGAINFPDELRKKMVLFIQFFGSESHRIGV